MEARKFNSSPNPRTHHLFLGRILNMEVNHHGPDLSDPYKIVEIKFCLNPGRQGWTVDENQMAYGNNGKTGYWALGRYEMTRPVAEVKTTVTATLERMVTKREIWVVPWRWMDQFQGSRCTGVGKNGRTWDHTLRYAKKAELPDVKESVDIEKGVIHLTKGVRRDDFSYLFTGIPF